MTKGNLVVHQGQDALIVALVMWTQNYVMTLLRGRIRQFPCVILRPQSTGWSGQDDLGGGVFRLDAFNRRKDWLTAQKHPVATTIRSIIDGFMWAKTKIA